MRFEKLVGPVIAVVIALVLVIGGIGNVSESLNADEQMVIQYPNGHMEVFTTPGWKPQWWGRVTKYHKRTTFDFTAPTRDDKVDRSIEVRFNDAGHGKISGSLAWEMPTDRDGFLRAHALFGSQTAIEQRLIAPAVTKAIYMTGPLMSSKESYADRRTDLLSLIDDQVKNGVLRTRSYQQRQIDPITGQERTITVVEPVRDSSGRFVREDQSPLAEFGIRTFNLAIDGIAYSQEVESQIKEQQAMTMAVQTSIMEAKRAEQNAITTEQNGKAAAASAKWKQEVIKAQMVTEAEQNKEVAALAVQTAQLTKQRLILEGEGEAEKKRLAMSANGALEQKLDAMVKMNAAWADAWSNNGSQIVPGVVMGTGASNTPNGLETLVQLMTMQFAKQVGLDTNVRSGASGTAPTKTSKK